MVDKALISVVVPTYKLQAEYLSDALESVLGQSFSAIEAVVIHDGSDEILDVISRFAVDKRIKAYREKDRGYISALNQGVEQAQGEFIAFCDSDDVYYKDHLRFLHEELERHPNTGVAFDNLEYFYDTATAGIESLTTPGKKQLLLDENRLARFGGNEVSLQDVFVYNLISGPAFMIPKRVFPSTGLFDENSFLVNDLHLFYRIGSRFPLRCVNYLGVRKRVHAKNLTVVYDHYEYGVKCLENIRDCYPEVYRRIGAKVFNRKLGRKYYRLGLYYSKNGKRELAREMFRRAARMRVFNLRYYLAYLRAPITK